VVVVARAGRRTSLGRVVNEKGEKTNGRNRVISVHNQRTIIDRGGLRVIILLPPARAELVLIYSSDLLLPPPLPPQWFAEKRSLFPSADTGQVQPSSTSPPQVTRLGGWLQSVVYDVKMPSSTRRKQYHYDVVESSRCGDISNFAERPAG